MNLETKITIYKFTPQLFTLTPHHESDWDILILLDKSRIYNEDFDRVAYPLVELGWKIGADINPLIYTYTDWQRRSFTLFYKNVEQEGIELCH